VNLGSADIDAGVEGVEAKAEAEGAVMSCKPFESVLWMFSAECWTGRVSCTEDGRGGEGQGETIGLLLEKVRECLFDFGNHFSLVRKKLKQRHTL
jgi:hypothetical protein